MIGSSAETKKMTNSTYNHILVPVDGSVLSGKVLPHILAFSSAFNPKITLTEVTDSLIQINTKLAPLPNYTAGLYSTELAKQVYKSENIAAINHLKKLQQKLHDCGVVNVSIKVLDGNPADEIIKLAKRESCDLIIMSTHGRSGLKRLLLGSVTDQVLHQANCPVLVVRPKIKSNNS